MSGWRISSTPPQELIAWSTERPALFASPHFAEALSALGAQCLFAWHSGRETGFLVPVFSRLRWLRVAFLGFPVCPRGGEAAELGEQLLAGGSCQVVRIVAPMLAEPPTDGAALLPDVWIESLASWSPSPKVRRDLAYAARHLAGWRLVRDRLDGAAAAKLYQRVIARHGGRAVYGPGYFKRLAAALGAAPGLRAFALEDEAGGTRAFAVLAIHEDTGYYLHAAADDEARRRGAGDLLLGAVVDSARGSGCRRIDLMASPPAQTGLLAFKRKWGDRLGSCATRHAARGAIGRAVAAALSLTLRLRSRRR